MTSDWQTLTKLSGGARLEVERVRLPDQGVVIEGRFELPPLAQLTAEDWDDYYDTVVRPHVQEVRPRGQYAAAARKRRAAEQSGEPEG